MMQTENKTETGGLTPEEMLSLQPGDLVKNIWGEIIKVNTQANPEDKLPSITGEVIANGRERTEIFFAFEIRNHVTRAENEN